MVQRIIVEVSGGVVQHVQVPPGINAVVQIIDYDGEDESDFANRDQYGAPCNVANWAPDEHGPPDLREHAPPDLRE